MEPYVDIIAVAGKDCFQHMFSRLRAASFTDQMHAAAELFDGTVAAVCDPTVDKAFCISLIHSDALWSENG